MGREQDAHPGAGTEKLKPGAQPDTVPGKQSE